MNLNNFFHESKIIAAVKDEAAFKKALKSKCPVIFLLFGNILNVKKIVEEAHAHKKIIFLHFDMIEGFGKDEIAVRYIKEQIEPDGIISIKSSVIKWAESYDLSCVYRIFMIDSQSYDTALNNIRRHKIENIEIMPGIIPEVVSALVKECPANYICGGLITTEKQVKEIIASGAIACSTSNEQLWEQSDIFNI